ncbi:MAG: MraY family glycosyltransferase [Planctomycetota bacterium]|nr:MraY family glycosyltransferase [Planctomycetota bacterium]
MCAALIASVVATWVVVLVARAAGLLAPVRADRWHSNPVALHGGVAMIAVLVGVALVSHRDWLPSRPGEGMPIEASPEAWLLLASIAAAMAGLADDLLHFRPATKLALLFGVATIVIVGLGFGRVTGVAWLDIALTYLWFLLVANAVNMLDNMDGLAAGAAAFGAAACAVVAHVAGRHEVAALAGVVAAIVVGFLVWNRPRARVFMGDSGSLFLGMMLAGLAGLATGWMGPAAGASVPEGGGILATIDPLALSVLLLALPLADTGFVCATRLARGQSPMVGGRDHSSHRIARLADQASWSRASRWGVGLAVISIGPMIALAVAEASRPGAATIAVVLVAAAALLAGHTLASRVPVRSASDAVAPGLGAEAAMAVLARASEGISALRREALDAVFIAMATVVGYVIRFGLPLPADSALVLRQLVPVTVAACVIACAAVGVYEPVSGAAVDPGTGRMWSRQRTIVSRTVAAATLGFLASTGVLVLLDWLPVGFSRSAWAMGLCLWAGVLWIRSTAAAARGS